MKVGTNLNAINNIGTMQQVSANNVANTLTPGFKASRAVQNGDTVTISQEARHAAIDSNGRPMSTTDLGQEMVRMTANKASLNANVKAIRTQSEMDQALLSIIGK